ncbi:energy transducer TonB [Coraliomargarita sp. SDUM461004]|uniref:Energy transducer TonB n=1 Tax=Thalassobacterium sedimentorum TaxID=3041258 RepID=A0ABU1AHP3_9BACT|nr:energy transducer TonB [Coraliomargarita sp. SDUM461004]MDQ8194295.1 energy transducer TonB [Coraliomargarita sp. SDUM461004]
MSKLYNAPKYRGSTRAFGTALGIGVSAILFLAIPLTQIFNKFEKSPEQIETIDMAPPPPPPPPEDPPEPPPPEEEEPPPELNTPPPPISLEQLDMALNPGTGGSMAGDFALPTFDVNSSDLGGLEIFELGDVDSPPQPRTKIEFSYPSAAKRKGITGVVKVEYIVNENGRVEQINIVDSPDRSLSKATEEVLERARFEPAQKSGRAVKVRMRAAIPYR